MALAADVLALPGCEAGLLTNAERERAAAFRQPVDRDAFVAAHVLARLCGAALTGRPASSLTLRQHCSVCGGAHGKPTVAEVPAISVSLSHTRGVVVAAAGWRAIGVDAELLSQPAAPAELVRRVLTDREADGVLAAEDPHGAFLLQWVRKEALIKVGAATLGTLGHLDLSALPTGPSRGVRRLRFGPWHLLELSGSGAITAAVGAEPVAVVGLRDVAREGGLG